MQNFTRGSVQINKPSPLDQKPKIFPKRYLSLEWTFSQRIDIILLQREVSVLLLGCGPYIYSFVEKDDPAKNENFQLEAQLNVFAATGTYARGAVALDKGCIAAWGDSYLAHIPVEQLLRGGTVCQQNILSTGKSVISIKSYDIPLDCFITSFEICFADGSIQQMVYRKKRNVPSILPVQFVRLPLEPGETITAGYMKSELIHFGTSQGRFISLSNGYIQHISEPLMNSSVRQITTSKEKNDAAWATLLLFDNGSIVSWKGKEKPVILKGRYTRMTEFSLCLADIPGERYTIAGDRDGTLTSIRVDSGKLEIIRVMKNFTDNPITVIERINRKSLFIGTNMGEFQRFDLCELFRPKREKKVAVFVDESDCQHKKSDGWFYVKNDRLFASERTCLGEFFFELYDVEEEKLKMKYLSTTGYIDRELVVAYSRKGYFSRVRDYWREDDGKIDDCEAEGVKVVQVILMQFYILVQFHTGEAELIFIDLKTDSYNFISKIAAKDRIRAAACVVRPNKERLDPLKASIKSKLHMNLTPLELLVAYDHGEIEVFPVEWHNSGVQWKMPSYTFTVDVQSSYIVSMITYSRLFGQMQCIMLSKRGIAYLVEKLLVVGCKDVYVTTAQQDLSQVIGNGHSLMETSHGILAAGFKRNTLNVCQLTLFTPAYPECSHLFSVDTASYRLPFTVMEIKKNKENAHGRETTNSLIVSYHKKNGITEDRFSFTGSKRINRLKHTGIISNCYIRRDLDEGEVFYTGDTDGHLCIWLLQELSLDGKRSVNDFKVNGAVTDICNLDRYIIVSTSQGELNLFARVHDLTTQVLSMVPYKMEQKISCMAEFADSSTEFLLVFLGDGIVKQIKFEDTDGWTRFPYTAEEVMKVKKVAKFPGPTKMAQCKKFKGQYYIIALGIDGTLRRTHLSPRGNATVEMKWKITVIKDIFDGKTKHLHVGDHHGRVYVILSSNLRDQCFYIDQVHKHEIVDICFYTSPQKELFVFSLDITGIVVIRKLTCYKWFRPAIWRCPVPSARKITVIEKRQIMVVGRGIATRDF